ncbi:MAG: hypothetical protein PF961_02305 [Planctomycetota bacterium]|jgi:hypothetical protein|nr:hypothetical protein [Planctomycetota bacterium]
MLTTRLLGLVTVLSILLVAGCGGSGDGDAPANTAFVDDLWQVETVTISGTTVMPATVNVDGRGDNNGAPSAWAMSYPAGDLDLATGDMRSVVSTSAEGDTSTERIEVQIRP